MRRMRDMAASVGVSGKNLSADVWLIQELLNKPEVLNGDRPFMINGKMDAITVERIKAFQKNIVKMASPDGRIDPNGKTIKALMNLANPVLLKYQLSARGVNLLKSIERLELKPYDDHTGKEVSEFVAGATIGYGHLIKENEWELYKNGITEQEARELIRKDFGSFVQLVNRLVKKQISMNQFDALVMFSFNIGPTAFRDSTVLKLINDPNIDVDSKDVEKSWKIFKHQGGKVKPGLVNRRNCEWDIYTKNVYKMW